MNAINNEELSFKDNQSFLLDGKRLSLHAMRSISMVFCLVLILTGSTLKAQNVRDTTIFAPLVSLSYSAQVPMGDLADRFGWNSNIGLNADFKLANNWLIGVNGQFMFGNNVKDTTMLRDLTTVDGQIINEKGEFANVLAFERGWIFTVNAGRVFPIFGPNPNSGLLMKVGVGYWQHKVRFDGEQNLVPQFVDEYRKLYDRFTSGLAINQFIGYQHLGNNRLANFFVGVESNQGFTKGRRDYQAGAPFEVKQPQFDMTLGVRAGWIVPIYRRAPKEFYLD